MLLSDNKRNWTGMRTGSTWQDADLHRRLRTVLICTAVAVLAACSSVPPGPPRIERLPASASGLSAPAKIGAYSMDEVVSMARAGDPAPVIVQKLRDSRTPSGGLSNEQANSLARQGVPADVLLWLRLGDSASGAGPRSAYREACLRNPYCRSPGYLTGYPYYYGPAYPYGFGYPPYRSGLSFGFRRWP